jgi:dTDP-glucose 4,6-dehydratase
VLQAARQSGVQRLVHTSTSEVYGTARYVPIDEGHPLQGQSPYSASKIGADKLVEAFHLSFQVPVTTVRPFNTYGPRQSSRAVIPTIITQALTQPQVQLGNLQSTRDFNYVEDTVSGFVNAAESEAALGQVLNLGSGRETSIGELAKLILELTGKSDLPIVTDAARLRPEASEVDRLCADPSQAQAKLGWQSAHTLEEGLLATIDWVRSNLESYRIGTYTI